MHWRPHMDHNALLCYIRAIGIKSMHLCETSDDMMPSYSMDKGCKKTRSTV